MRVYTLPEATGGGGDLPDYPWKKFSGLTLGAATNPDSYVTSLSEPSSGRIQLTVDATVPNTRAADLATIWDLGTASDIDLISELLSKSDPLSWVLEIRITVNQWPTEVASNHWFAVGIPETPSSTPGLTAFCYLRDADGTLEPMVFGNWGNNAFTPGTRSRGIANHVQTRFRLRPATTGVDCSAEVIAHQDGALSLAHNFDSATANDDWTPVHLLLAVQHETVGLNASDLVDLTLEGRIRPLDYEFSS